MARAYSNFAEKILNVAWLSIILGIVMQGLMILVSVFFGKFPVVNAIISELVQKVSWSSIVCMGLAAGTVASKLRGPVMGLAGLLAAPLAFSAARVVHKSVSQALSVAGPTAAAVVPSVMTVALIKAVQYAFLGYLLGLISRQEKQGVLAYILTGFFVGLVFGGLILVWTVLGSPASLPLAGLVSRAVNEIIFPVGCALVLYSAQRMSAKI